LVFARVHVALQVYPRLYWDNAGEMQENTGKYENNNNKKQETRERDTGAARLHFTS
jgi:hypothetical protein